MIWILFSSKLRWTHLCSLNIIALLSSSSVMSIKFIYEKRARIVVAISRNTLWREPIICSEQETRLSHFPWSDSEWCGWSFEILNSQFRIDVGGTQGMVVRRCSHPFPRLRWSFGSLKHLLELPLKIKDYYLPLKMNELWMLMHLS